MFYSQAVSLYEYLVCFIINDQFWEALTIHSVQVKQFFSFNYHLFAEGSFSTLLLSSFFILSNVKNII
jgi:hypothetical protein